MLHIRQFRWAPAIVAAALVAAAGGCSGSGSPSNNSAPAPNRPYPQATPQGDGTDRPSIGAEVDAAEQPDSTFAIDIDTASYNFARRQLLDGRRPSPDTV